MRVQNSICRLVVFETGTIIKITATAQLPAPLHFSEGHAWMTLAFANTRRTIVGRRVVDPEVNAGTGPQEQIGFDIHAVRAVIDCSCRAIMSRIKISANQARLVPTAITIPFLRWITHLCLHFSDLSFDAFSNSKSSANSQYPAQPF